MSWTQLTVGAVDRGMGSMFGRRGVNRLTQHRQFAVKHRVLILPPGRSGYVRGLSMNRKEAGVPDFRYYCLNGEDRIILGAHVIAVDLGAAIRVAYKACRDHPHLTSSRIEVWQGPSKLYATEATCPGNLTQPG